MTISKIAPWPPPGRASDSSEFAAGDQQCAMLTSAEHEIARMALVGGLGRCPT